MKKNVRLPVHVRPERYKIMLKPDLDKFTFTGQVTIDLLLDKPTKQITLHAVELEIEAAEFIHQQRKTWAGKISYDPSAETATFTFPKKIQKGKGKLKLIFKGVLNDKMRGFYRSQYEVDGVKKHLAITQFESTDARRAFPCFDEPSQKAIFDVTLIVASNNTVISNTIKSDLIEHENSYLQMATADHKIVAFKTTPKVSTYLLAFIVGEFEYIEAPLRKDRVGQSEQLVRVFTTPGKKNQAEFALDVAVKCTRFFEDYFDIPYPLPTLDMIAIPDFAAGAMENWGAVTYRESALLIDEERSSSANKQWVALVIAHELAHQWFGNLVTMKWWNDLWLNEGFASFVEYFAIDHIFPEWDIWTQFVATEMRDAFSLDSLKNTHPIEVEVSDPAEISEIFDRISYSKGASVLRMLMSYLGEKDFQNGLRHYLKKFAYQNAETSDLWTSLEIVSGKPVKKIMECWTTEPGHPVITVSEQGSKLKLTQSRFFSSPISKQQTKDKTIWSIPLKGVQLMDKKSITIPNTKVKLNLGEVSLVRVDYPRNYLRRLENSIKNNRLPAPDRLGLIRDSFDLAEAGESPTSLALELAQNFVDEEDYIVWAELTVKLNRLNCLLADEPCYGNFKHFGRKLYTGIAGKLGWEKQKTERHTDGLLRGIIFRKLGSFGDEATTKKAKELFRKGKIDPDLLSSVYSLVAENGSLKEFQRLIKMYKKEDNQQERDRIGRSLGCFRSKKLLQKTLDFSISKHVRFQNSLQIMASVWGNPAGRYLAWEFVKRNWELLKERYAGGHIFPKIFLPMGNFTKASDAKEIEKFIANNSVSEAKRTIAQALEQIYSNAEWLKRDSRNISKFLEKFD
ncbi:M1 family metallopeptidase [Patescibacteria group bacterium]|nr:M1 family metallopeptidase [Patescibacteria group bacterium]